MISAGPERDPDRADAPALEIKLGALVVLLSVALLFGFLPLCAVLGGGGRCSVNPGSRRRLLALTSCFSGGVFLATCLLDLLPDFLRSIDQAFRSAGIKLQFPLPEFIVAVGFLLVLVLEQIVLELLDRGSSPPEERQALLEDGGVQTGPPQGAAGPRAALRALVLLLSLSLHAVLEGVAVGLLEDGRAVLDVCLALLIHKSVVSFSLSAALTRARLRRAVATGCLLAFAAMSPLGVALGVGLGGAGASPRHRLALCSLEGLAAGTFLYVTFVDILPPELAAAQGRIPKTAVMLLGFTVVTGALFLRL